MERRTLNRKRTETKVFLHHRDLPTTSCMTRDLSSGGVFVETRDAMNVQRGNRLELTFAVDLGNVTRLYQLSVVVAQVAVDGLGLVIDRSVAPHSSATPRRVEKHNGCEVLSLKPQRSSRRKPSPAV